MARRVDLSPACRAKTPAGVAGPLVPCSRPSDRRAAWRGFDNPSGQDAKHGGSYGNDTQQDGVCV